jgi:hypothetical protein
MTRKIVVFLVLPLLAACPDSAIYVYQEIAPGMVIDARIDTSVRRFRPGEVKVLGNIVVTNSSDQTIRYSNSRLWLSVDDEISRRTYLDNISSHIVDTGFVEILSGDNLSLSVYWVLPEDIGRSLDGHEVTLELAIP